MAVPTHRRSVLFHGPPLRRHHRRAAARRPAASSGRSTPDAIGAFVAEMDFGTAPVVPRALHDAVDLGQLGYLPDAAAGGSVRGARPVRAARTAGRSPPTGSARSRTSSPACRSAIEYFSRAGRRRDPADAGLHAVPHACRRALGREVMRGADGPRRRPVRLRPRRASTRPSTRAAACWSSCNPHNPIGRVLDRRRAGSRSPRSSSAHGGRVFSDEIHAPLVYDGARPRARTRDVGGGRVGTRSPRRRRRRRGTCPGLKCAQLVLTNDADAGAGPRSGSSPSTAPPTLGVVANTAAYDAGEPVAGRRARPTSTATARCSASCSPSTCRRSATRPPEGTYLAWLDCRRARPRRPARPSSSSSTPASP